MSEDAIARSRVRFAVVAALVVTGGVAIAIGAVYLWGRTHNVVLVENKTGHALTNLRVDYSGQTGRIVRLSHGAVARVTFSHTSEAPISLVVVPLPEKPKEWFQLAGTATARRIRFVIGPENAVETVLGR